MGKSPDEVKVQLDRSFTYPITGNRRRTLPAGWRGSVPADIAARIEKGFGRKISRKALGQPKAAEPGKSKSAAKAALDEADDQAPTGPAK
ncbi:hypothetical protein [Limimaricola pyoseonensis]|uniref:Uncharacterized protein n=1 Tax=Limimaricola pyoseonensis TaxID=521013 RepID=A0A1G7GQ85_9RHOB|nr:hypothetical protein [Limimaricola pyoseonensis]SDE90274.1 hypothetical protein SAMN04488567_2878 [Limimaricola pyoseonensis]